MNRLLKDRILHSDLVKPSKILDVGCGTGSLTCKLAILFPQAQVYGVDLTKVPSSNSYSVPPNVTFIRGNIRSLAGEHVDIQKDAFDLVFSRLLIAGMRDWPGYVATCKELLRPGGWLEIQDLDLNDHKEGVGALDAPKFMGLIRSISAERGMDYLCGSNAERYLMQAGFQRIQVDRYKWPYGLWMAHTNPETEAAGQLADEQLGGLRAHQVRAILGDSGRFSQEEIEAYQEEALSTAKPTDGHYRLFTVTRGIKGT